MSNLLFSLNIVMPMAILLAIGYLFKQIGFIDDHFVSVGKKLCFYVFLSSSLFKNLYDSSLDDMPYTFIIFVVCMILAEIFISRIVAGSVSEKRDQIGVIMQGSFRSNFAYICGDPSGDDVFYRSRIDRKDEYGDLLTFDLCHSALQYFICSRIDEICG